MPKRLFLLRLLGRIRPEQALDTGRITEILFAPVVERISVCAAVSDELLRVGLGFEGYRIEEQLRVVVGDAEPAHEFLLRSAERLRLGGGDELFRGGKVIGAEIVFEVVNEPAAEIEPLALGGDRIEVRFNQLTKAK